MITAVALPSILVDLVEPTGGSAWIELRKASWIINGYLLVYVVTMPLAGRLADLWGARRLFIGALSVFVVGSALAGASQNLDQLIAARLVQGVGGGVLVPVATAAASHLFEGHDRPRALGVIGALTFLGMAAGPFVGAAILGGVHVEGAVVRLGVEGGTLAAALAPAWRWIFYVNVPIGIVAIVLAWAASAGWETPRRPGSRRRHRRDAVHDRPRERADRADAPRERRHRGHCRRPGGHQRGPVRDRGGRHGPHDPARPSPGDAVPRGAPLPERVVQLGGPRVAADRLRVRDGDHRRRRVRRPRPVRRPGRPAARARRARRS